MLRTHKRLLQLPQIEDVFPEFWVISKQAQFVGIEYVTFAKYITAIIHITPNANPITFHSICVFSWWGATRMKAKTNNRLFGCGRTTKRGYFMQELVI